MPPDQRARHSYMRLSATDVQRVILRSMALDEFLSSNLVRSDGSVDWHQAMRCAFIR